MRIHGDQITMTDIRRAARDVAGVNLERNGEHGSRSRVRAFDVILSGSGRTGTRYGMDSTYIAATWDEWGIFLAELFRTDPSLTIPGVYEDAEHFRWVTGGRFDDLTLAGQHVRHRWEYAGTAITGFYSVRECRCGAVNRWVVADAWADVASLV